MIVTLNGFNLNDNLSGAYLDTQITGLDLPSIRTSSGNYAGRDGGYIGAQFLGPRQINLQGSVFAADVASLEAVRKAFQTALRPLTVAVGIVTNAGAAYLIYANVIDFEMPITQGLFRAPFNLELLAPDPTIYDNATGTALTANLGKATAGGYTYPVVYPVVYGAGTGPTTITNSGTVSVWPTITLTGSAANPLLTNSTTGEFIGFNLTMGVGDVLAIDMRARTALLNGGNVFGLITSGSTFWRLPPGGSNISLTTSTTGDAVTGVVSWRSGFSGI